mmetsp:Transcript_18446/g.24083  ORF Transcript_18446/g.24083 Transcript_18446/m.24083 type:complete len:509 (-) Transcript_18446:1837-3363(-)
MGTVDEIPTTSPYWHQLLPNQKPIDINSQNSTFREYIYARSFTNQAESTQSEPRCCCLCSTTFCWQETGKKTKHINQCNKDRKKCLAKHCWLEVKPSMVLIIGGGMTGLSCALRLSDLGCKNIVLVDERGIGDGASGRNGGHQWPELRKDCSKDPDEFCRLCGEIEMKDTERLRNLINGLPAEEKESIELHVTGGLNVTLDEKEVPFLKEFVREVQALGIDSNRISFLQADQARSYCKDFSSIKGGLELSESAQFVPAMLLVALTRILTSRGVKIFTRVKVESINRLQSSEGHNGWIVSASHDGALEHDKSANTSFTVSKIVHATNGYGLHILPTWLRSRMSAYRGQVVAVKVPEKICLSKSIIFKANSMSHEEYLIQRMNDRVVIFGGYRHKAEGDAINVANDDETEETVTLALLRQLESVLGIDQIEAKDVLANWSGIMCTSEDGEPIVGEIRESRGQFVALGYNGNGMVRAHSCGIHIAEIIMNVDPSCPEIQQVFDANRFWEGC